MTLPDRETFRRLAERRNLVPRDRFSQAAQRRDAGIADRAAAHDGIGDGVKLGRIGADLRIDADLFKAVRGKPRHSLPPARRHDKLHAPAPHSRKRAPGPPPRQEQFTTASTQRAAGCDRRIQFRRILHLLL